MEISAVYFVGIIVFIGVVAYASFNKGRHVGVKDTLDFLEGEGYIEIERTK